MTPATQQDNLLYDRLKAVIAASRDLRNPLIEVLRQAQEIFGYLPVEVQEFVAREMNIPANKIYGVVTFYNFFTMTPRGKLGKIWLVGVSASKGNPLSKKAFFRAWARLLALAQA